MEEEDIVAGCWSCRSTEYADARGEGGKGCCGGGYRRGSHVVWEVGNVVEDLLQTARTSFVDEFMSTVQLKRRANSVYMWHVGDTHFYAIFCKAGHFDHAVEAASLNHTFRETCLT